MQQHCEHACDEGGPLPEAAPERASRKLVLGVGVNALEPDAAFEWITQCAMAHRGGRIAFMPVHSLVTAARCGEFARVVRDFSLVLPDGQPVRWLLNGRHRTHLRERVYGPTMMGRLCHWAAQQGAAVYLYGGRPDVLPRLIANLRAKFPGICIAGAESPPFREMSDDELRQAAGRMNAGGARLIFIGLGCPKQELIAGRLKGQVAGVQLCVGAAFDFHAGTLAMAPAWMQRCGLEWLFRLVVEPRRLWRRYLVTNTLFLAMCLREFIRPRRERCP